jgi:hypothetical protein
VKPSRRSRTLTTVVVSLLVLLKSLNIVLSSLFISDLIITLKARFVKWKKVIGVIIFFNTKKSNRIFLVKKITWGHYCFLIVNFLTGEFYKFLIVNLLTGVFYNFLIVNFLTRALFKFLRYENLNFKKLDFFHCNFLI